MNVLYVLDSLAPGGTERSTVVLAPALRERGVTSTIVILRKADPDLSAEAEAAGVPVHRLAATTFVGRARELRRLIRGGDFDVVHTALFRADQVGRVAAYRTGVPVVSSFVNTPYEPARLADPNVVLWKLRLTQTIDAITGRLMVDTFHSVSEGAKAANARALRIPLDRIVVAERGRDAADLGEPSEERRRAVRSDLGLSNDDEVVLNLGRQEFQKAQTVLVEVATLLAERHPRLVVLIAGKDGSASEDLRHSIESSPVASEHVRLLGHRTDIGDLICAADVMAISSLFEGTAGAAIEAMALSTPIVSTDVAGLRGILEQERNALLVQCGDVDALASGIDRVLTNRWLADRMAAAAATDFESRFPVAAGAERLGALYRQTVAQGAVEPPDR